MDARPRRGYGILRSLLVGAALIAAASPPARAQSVVLLEGRIIDTADNRLRDAHVELVGFAEVTTDNNGIYRFIGVPPGTYLVRVRQVGYAPVLLRAVVQDAPVVRLDAELLPLTHQLERVTVTETPVVNRLDDPGGFSGRRGQHVGGFFMSEDEIAQRSATKTEQLFRTVPFVHVSDDGTLRTGGPTNGRGSPLPARVSLATDGQCKFMQVFVDGAHVADGFDVNTIAPAAIRAIEVYRDAATTPPELRSFGTICGTVAIWTK